MRVVELLGVTVSCGVVCYSESVAMPFLGMSLICQSATLKTGLFASDFATSFLSFTPFYFGEKTRYSLSLWINLLLYVRLLYEQTIYNFLFEFLNASGTVFDSIIIMRVIKLISAVRRNGNRFWHLRPDGTLCVFWLNTAGNKI